MTDLLAALRTYLLAVSEVATPAEDRIFLLELPSSENCEMPQKALVLNLAGGGGIDGQGTMELATVRIDVFAYGATPLEAWDLQRAVHAAMKALARETVGAVVLHRASEGGGPIYFRDPDAQWPVVLQSWMVMASTTEAA